MKIISFYLPQFHVFPENEKWWGKGFTEWTNTKKAKPLFKGHYQPHIPYNNDYYDLTDSSVMKRQVNEAIKYGIYGFCFYHYWFKDGKKLMEKPLEHFLKDKTLNLHFCISWANEPWTRRWDGGSKEVLMPQEYGNKSNWIEHFNYLQQFFNDDRYIRINGKPLILIYRPEIINCLDEMLEVWRELAYKNGFPGLVIMAQGSTYCRYSSTRKKNSSLDAYVMYEPGYTYSALALKDRKNLVKNMFYYRQFFCHYFLRKILSIIKRNYFKNINITLDICNYDIIWAAILKNKVYENYYPGAFTGWDNSARRGTDARIIVEGNPQKFEKYLTKLIIKAKNEFHKDYLFINAWNEWAEGAHLEADIKYGYEYLEAVKSALLNTGEWENT